ncbi:MAG: serine/threonine-protein kinase [Planctomycetota bacterium]
MVLGRFALEAPIGSGGQGTVWRARDRVTRSVAAVKVLPGLGPDAVGALRREVAALRLLRIPGVVPLLDTGAEEGTGNGIVAMQWIVGERFGARTAALPGARWGALAPTVVALLETLSRVHAAGIVHRDLKPANVLVDAHGAPTLLDLGIASGVALDARGGPPLAGTPRYMAPALFEGAPPSPATDLFAFAVMVFEALTGELPRPDDLGALVAGEGLGHGELRARLAASAPPSIAEAFAPVLSREGHGVESAEDLLRAIGAADEAPARALAATAMSLVGSSRDALDLAALQGFFQAEERIVSHRSTAARLLGEVCGGQRATLVPELARWLARGIGRVRGGRLVLEELDLERLEQWRGQRTFVAQQSLTDTWLAKGISGLTERTLAETRARVERGEFREALGELPTLVSVATQLARNDLLAELLESWLLAALVAADRNALALLLHELERSDLSGAHGATVAAIATAALAALDGATVRATERLRAAGEPRSFALGRSWHAVDVFIARRRGEDEALATALAAARVWASKQPHVVPELDTWEGWFAFHRGDFAGALRHHEAAAAAHRGPRRAHALLDAGAAALEGGSCARARALADEARAVLDGQRQPFARGRVEWLARAADYRLGVATAVDEELVAAAHAIGAPHVAGLALLTEAAVAWRAAQDARAATIALESARLFEAAGESSLAILPRGLAAVAQGARAGSERGAPAGSPRASTAAPNQPPVGLDLRAAYPALSIQAAELWLRAGHTLEAADLLHLRALWRLVAQWDLAARREVLALGECAAVAALCGE